MITRLSLHNFKRHADLELDFGPGVNILCGPNYSGKSSVLHAILFCLRGVAAVPGGSKLAWRRGSTKTKVEMEFSLNGVNVSLTRTKSSAVLVENGMETARGTAAVNRRVEALLGLSWNDFAQIKYAQQKETAALLTSGATALNELIERVSGAALIGEVIDRVKTVGTAQGATLKALSPVDPTPLAAELTEAQSGLQRAEQALDLFEKDEESLLRARTAAQEKLSQAQDFNERIRQAVAELSSLEARAAAAKEKLDLSQAELEALPQVDSEKLEISEQELTDLQELSDRHHDLRAELRRSERQLHLTQEGLQALRKDCQSLEDQIQAAQAGVATLPGRRRTLEAITSELAVRQSELRAAKANLESAVCPTCQRPYDADVDRGVFQAAVTELDAEVSRLTEQAQSLRDVVSELTLIQQEMDRRAASLSFKRESTLPELEQTLLQQQAQYESTAAALDQLPDCPSPEEIKHLEVEQAKARKAARAWERLSGVVEEQASSVQSLKEQINSYQEIRSEVDEAPLKAALAEAQEALREQAAGMAAARQEASGLAKVIEQIEARLAQVEETNAAVQKAETRLAQAISLREFLQKNRAQFLSQVWARLLAQASALCSDATGGYISAVLRDDGAFRYVEQGEASPLAGASGAQQSLMGLALKTALASSLPDSLNCLLLDEVTADMDETHAQAVTSLLGTTNHQVIAVSHRDMDRAGGYHVIDLVAEGAR